jgi:hypothetical protein
VPLGFAPDASLVALTMVGRKPTSGAAVPTTRSPPGFAVENFSVWAHTGAAPSSPPHMRNEYGVLTASDCTRAENGPVTSPGHCFLGVVPTRAGKAVGQYSKKL